MTASALAGDQLRRISCTSLLGYCHYFCGSGHDGRGVCIEQYSPTLYADNAVKAMAVIILSHAACLCGHVSHQILSVTEQEPTELRSTCSSAVHALADLLPDLQPWQQVTHNHTDLYIETPAEESAALELAHTRTVQATLHTVCLGKLECLGHTDVVYS